MFDLKKTSTRETAGPVDRRDRWARPAAVSAIVALAVLLAGGVFFAGVGGRRLEPVLSGSMRPGIQPGSLAVLEPVSIRRLRVGNVIAYLPPGRTTPVMHRIVSITPGGIVTKGDANPTTDPWGRTEPSGKSVYRLVAVIPNVGWLATARRQLMEGIGAALVLLLAATVRLGRRRGDVSTERKIPLQPRPTSQ